MFVVGNGEGEGGFSHVLLKVAFLGDVMSSPAVLRLEKEASVTNLWVWGKDCETRVVLDLKQVGLGWNTRKVGRRDPPPLGLAQCGFLFPDPSVDVGRKGTYTGAKRREGRMRVM